jgi:hypothetical protein
MKNYNATKDKATELEKSWNDDIKNQSKVAYNHPNSPDDTWYFSPVLSSGLQFTLAR